MALFRQLACIETAEQKNDQSLRSDMGKSFLKVERSELLIRCSTLGVRCSMFNANSLGCIK